MTDDELRGIDIHEILPQVEPFVMVGRIVHCDEVTMQTETLIKGDNIFVENGRFMASGMMENIAQSCAARVGYINKYILQKGVRIGFIGAVKDFKVVRRPAVGEIITTSVELVHEVFGLTMVKARIESGEDVLATAEMKIALQNEECL